MKKFIVFLCGLIVLGGGAYISRSYRLPGTEDEPIVFETDPSLYPHTFKYIQPPHDQILSITVDEHVGNLIENQLGGEVDGNITDGIDEFSIVQDQTTQSTLLYLHGESINIQRLESVGLITTGSGYEYRWVTDDLLVVGDEISMSTLPANEFQQSDPRVLVAQYGGDLPVLDQANVFFLSRPLGELGAQLGLAAGLVDVLQGTTGAFFVSDSGTNGNLYAHIKDGSLENINLPEYISSLVPTGIADFSLGIRQVFDMFGGSKTSFVTMMNLLGKQVLGDVAALFSKDDRGVIYESLNSTLLMEVVPTEIGNGRRLSIENDELFGLLSKNQQLIRGYAEISLFAGKKTDFVLEKDAFYRADASNSDIRLATVQKKDKSTVLSFLFPDQEGENALSFSLNQIGMFESSSSLLSDQSGFGVDTKDVLGDAQSVNASIYVDYQKGLLKVSF